MQITRLEQYVRASGWVTSIFKSKLAIKRTKDSTFDPTRDVDMSISSTGTWRGLCLYPLFDDLLKMQRFSLCYSTKVSHRHVQKPMIHRNSVIHYSVIDLSWCCVRMWRQMSAESRSTRVVKHDFNYHGLRVTTSDQRHQDNRNCYNKKLLAIALFGFHALCKQKGENSFHSIAMKVV